MNGAGQRIRIEIKPKIRGWESGPPSKDPPSIIGNRPSGWLSEVEDSGSGFVTATQAAVD